jgi:hypothetical protein
LFDIPIQAAVDTNTFIDLQRSRQTSICAQNRADSLKGLAARRWFHFLNLLRSDGKPAP